MRACAARLTLAIDRNEASKALSQISVMKYVGGVFRPGSEFATPPAELVKLPGFGKDINAARAEAKQLLKEAGVPEGFSFVLKNRNVKEPYEVSGVYVVDQWRKIGLNVTHMPLEGGPYFNDLRQEISTRASISTARFMDEPDLYLLKYLSSRSSAVNYARYNDATLDELYERQSRMLDLKERFADLSGKWKGAPSASKLINSRCSGGSGLCRTAAGSRAGKSARATT